MTRDPEVHFGGEIVSDTLENLKELIEEKWSTIEAPAPGPADMFVPLSGVLIAGFGIVYALVALQPVRMKPVVWAGVFGKGGVLALALPPFFRGEVGLDAVVLSLGDLAFTIGFLVFLFTFRPKAKKD